MDSGFGFTNVLRVVGQTLQQRNIDLFELRIADENCFLRCGGTTPPYLELINFSYPLSEIKNLDLKAKAERSSRLKPVDFQSLPEILRTIGRRIDAQGGRLLRAYSSARSDREDSIVIEYNSRDRERHSEELFITTAGEYARRMYKSRAPSAQVQ